MAPGGLLSDHVGHQRAQTFEAKPEVRYAGAQEHPRVLGDAKLHYDRGLCRVSSSVDNQATSVPAATSTTRSPGSRMTTAGDIASL